MMLLNKISLLVLLFAVSCTGHEESKMKLNFKIIEKDMYSTIDFKDDESGQMVGLQDGFYNVEFEQGYFGISDPAVVISDENGSRLATINIPRVAFNKDDESFDAVHTLEGYNQQVNLSGGWRKEIIDRYVKVNISVGCTYTTVETKTVDGEIVVDVKTHFGTQDEVREYITFKRNYEVLVDPDYFEGAVAKFGGISTEKKENRALSSTNCN